ncbi:MAG TPA: ABC transporter substrate-binding protein [Pseudolabrys sp.]|nr:ABC transporter substrate-binding protein [Pseudolabrys sp.]
MKRREFLALIGAAVCRPLHARADQSEVPTLGFLHGSAPEGQVHVLRAFKNGLEEAGYVEGRNLKIEYRWARGAYDRLPAMAAELVRNRVSAIFAMTPVAALAAKHATHSIPVVFALGSDPVKDGLVESLNRPGGNITGVTFFSNLLIQKRLELLHELDPKASTVALLLNPENANAALERQQTETAAKILSMQLVVLDATTQVDLDKAFAALREKHITLLLISGDVLFNTRRDHVARLALQARVATCSANREQAAAGGLMSYGASITEAAREAGTYTGRVLKGVKPADLPVLEPTKFDFVINMKTAKQLGLVVPRPMQMLASEVIE